MTPPPSSCKFATERPRGQLPLSAVHNQPEQALAITGKHTRGRRKRRLARLRVASVGPGPSYGEDLTEHEED